MWRRRYDQVATSSSLSSVGTKYRDQQVATSSTSLPPLRRRPTARRFRCLVAAGGAAAVDGPDR